MKNTNQVQKALERKVILELDDVADKMLEALCKLRAKYNTTPYHSLRGGYLGDDGLYRDNITSVDKESLKRIFKRMLSEAYGGKMLEVKTKELLSKLEIL